MRAFPALAAHLFAASIVLLAGGAVPGCASITPMEVKLTRNALAPSRDQKTYRLACKNQLVQEWFLSDPKALLSLAAALEKLGYEEALDPALATHEIVAEIGFASRVPLQDLENPDSIRFKNVASMVGEGRYRQILTERDESGGSLLVGPDGRLIPTGGWKQVVKDTEERMADMPGTHDAMILRAWDVKDAAAMSARILAWEVVVLRPNDHRTPSPEHVGILIRHAAERLAAGWPDESAATAGSADLSPKQTGTSTPGP
jgi:hypothetical protein